MRRIPLLLMIIVPLLALAAPARAGGWAVTFMDPAPAGMRPNTTYTLGFWLLQHGTHPYEGANLGEVGLEFTSGKKRILFPGVPLKEPAHYAAAISLPPGTWQVEGVQGWFSPYKVGTLALPGDLKLAPFRKTSSRRSPHSRRSGTTGARSDRRASPTAPPLPSPSRRRPRPRPAAASAPLETTTVAVVEADSWWRPPYTPMALLGLVVLAVMAYRLRRR